MSHTPGPWHIDMNSDEEWLGVWNKDGCIAAIESDNPEEDARLIAAAPEMYEALLVARHYVAIAPDNGTPFVYQDLATVERAIAKAEGIEP